MWTIPDAAIGNISAAAVAAAVALIGLIIAKENKISEFRQTWIDQLRGELALFISHVNVIHMTMGLSSKGHEEVWQDVKDDFLKLNDVTGRIRMRLNVDESQSRNVLIAIEEIEIGLATRGRFDNQTLNAKEKDLVRKANIVLKREWRRVKSGERIYRSVILIAAAVLLAVLVLAIYFAVLGVSHPNVI